MKLKSLLSALVLLALSLAFISQDGVSQIPQTMSYQGVLTNADGTPVVDGVYNLTFRLYVVGTGGTAEWQETHSLVSVTDGVFGVLLGGVEPLTLTFDTQYWLGISVGGGAELEPRTKLASSPYSLNAQSVVNNAITGSKIADGNVVRSINGKTDDVTLAEGTNVTITPSSNTLTISSTFNGWNLTGNAGTTAGTHFLGTTDDQALELRVFGARVMRLEPHTTSPNIIGGYNTNSVTPGVLGATISGGGYNASSNRITDSYGTVSGGANNQAGDGEGTTDDASYATVGGGFHNNAIADYATVGGGAYNDVTADSATVGGGYENNATAYSATVGGGISNDATADSATVGGGTSNDATAYSATVGGGYDNQAAADCATVGGGKHNLATADFATIAGGGPSDLDFPNNLYTRNRVTDDYGTIGGGGNNRAGDDDGTTEGAIYATVGGGHSNQAAAHYAIVPGGDRNEANGECSFAAGRRAKANHDGCFVWGDSTDADVTSDNADQFTIRANGGAQVFCSGDYTALYVKADGTGNVADLIQDNSGNSAKTLYAENKGLGRAGHFRITNSSSTSDSVAASTQGSGNALVGYTTGSGNALNASTTGSGWAGYFQGLGASSNGVYISTGSGSQGLQVVGGSKSAVVKTSQGARALYSEEATEVWFTDYGFGRLENGRVAIQIDPLYMETVNLGEPYHVFIQVNDPDCQGVAVANRTATGFEVVELRNGRSDAEFSYRIVARRRGFEGERLEHREMADDDPNLVQNHM